MDCNQEIDVCKVSKIPTYADLTQSIVSAGYKLTMTFLGTENIEQVYSEYVLVMEAVEFPLAHP